MGIQPNLVAEIANILSRVHHEQGISLFIVEQNLDFAAKVAEKFYIMEKGSIVDQGLFKDVPIEHIKKHLTI